MEQVHPSYQHYREDWELMTHAYEGERVVKAQGERYLPAIPAMRQEGFPTPNTRGTQMYDAYRMRAVFPPYVTSGVNTLTGLIHRKPAEVSAPTRIEALLPSLGGGSETTQALLRQINEHQLKTGRCGLLVDVPSGQSPANAAPYIALYPALSVINWDTMDSGEPYLVVLNETSWELSADTVTWDLVEMYRVLALREGVFQYALTETVGSLDSLNWQTPQIAGRPLPRLPFVFCNAMDLNAQPSPPPLLGLGNRCMTIYRGEADYRQSLYMQGQETLFVIGAEDDEAPMPVGAHAVNHLPINGDAKYVGVTADGLQEQREALENDTQLAAEMGSRLVSYGSDSDRASGESLKVRIAAKTPTLSGVSLTSAQAVQELLGMIAEWLGVVGDITVTGNTDYFEEQFAGRELMEMQSAKIAGAPISSRTIHDNMRRNDLTVRTYEEEMAEIEGEEPPPANDDL